MNLHIEYKNGDFPFCICGVSWEIILSNIETQLKNDYELIDSIHIDLPNTEHQTCDEWGAWS